jgi:hypothetical protein
MDQLFLGNATTQERFERDAGPPRGSSVSINEVALPKAREASVTFTLEPVESYPCTNDIPVGRQSSTITSDCALDVSIQTVLPFTFPSAFELTELSEPAGALVACGQHPGLMEVLEPPTLGGDNSSRSRQVTAVNRPIIQLTRLDGDQRIAHAEAVSENTTAPKR